MTLGLVGHSEAEVVHAAGHGLVRRRHADRAVALAPRRRHAVERRIPSENEVQLACLRPSKPVDADGGRDVEGGAGVVLARGQQRDVELEAHHDLVVGRARERFALVDHLHLVRDAPDVLRAQIAATCVEVLAGGQRDCR